MCYLRIYCTLPQLLNAVTPYIFYTNSLKYKTLRSTQIPYKWNALDSHKLDPLLEIHKSSLCHGHCISSLISLTTAFGSASIKTNSFFAFTMLMTVNRKVIACNYIFLHISLNFSLYCCFIFPPLSPPSILSCGHCVLAMPWACRGSKQGGRDTALMWNTYFIESDSGTENLNIIQKRNISMLITDNQGDLEENITA